MSEARRGTIKKSRSGVTLAGGMGKKWTINTGTLDCPDVSGGLFALFATAGVLEGAVAPGSNLLNLSGHLAGQGKTLSPSSLSSRDAALGQERQEGGLLHTKAGTYPGLRYLG